MAFLQSSSTNRSTILVEFSVGNYSSTMKKHLETYCKESSIHGLNFIVDRGLHVVEKGFWVLTMLVSFVCCCLLTYKIGVKFMEDQIVTYVSDHGVSVTDVSSLMVGA
jgi:hypothetical protein